VTMAQHGNAGFYLDQALLRRGQIDSAGKKKSSEGLHMPAPQPGARTEDRGHERQRLLRDRVLELSS
jgi:hypothetical protein